MFNITKDDLTKKSDVQLTALFQQASQRLQPNESDLPQVQLLLALIRAEIAKRGPRP